MSYKLILVALAFVVNACGVQDLDSTHSVDQSEKIKSHEMSNDDLHDDSLDLVGGFSVQPPPALLNVLVIRIRKANVDGSMVSSESATCGLSCLQQIWASPSPTPNPPTGFSIPQSVKRESYGLTTINPTVIELPLSNVLTITTSIHCPASLTSVTIPTSDTDTSTITAQALNFAKAVSSAYHWNNFQKIQVVSPDVCSNWAGIGSHENGLSIVDSSNLSDYNSILRLSAHELGHSLGLAHSLLENMQPYSDETTTMGSMSEFSVGGAERMLLGWVQTYTLTSSPVTIGSLDSGVTRTYSKIFLRVDNISSKQGEALGISYRTKSDFVDTNWGDKLDSVHVHEYYNHLSPEGLPGYTELIYQGAVRQVGDCLRVDPKNGYGAYIYIRMTAKTSGVSATVVRETTASNCVNVYDN